VCSLVVSVRSQFSRLAVAMSTSRDRDWVGNPSARTMKKYKDQGIHLERIGPVAGPQTRWRVHCARCFENGRRRPFSTPNNALVHVRKSCWYSPPTEGVRCVCLPACLPVCLFAPAGPQRLQAVRSVVAGFHSSRAGLATKRLLVAVSFFAAAVIEEGRFDAHNCVAHDMDHSCICAGQRSPTPPPRDAAARCGPPIT
jgi:hypothetical protein